MNFKNEMQSYFKLRNLDDRKKKIHDILSQLETMQQQKDPIISLNMAEFIIEYCLLIENNDDRLLQYDRALELVQDTRRILKGKNQIRQVLRSYHLECLINYHTLKYKDEETSIQDIYNFGGKIIKTIKQAQTRTDYQYSENNDYYSLGCVWRAYGLILQLVNKYKELSIEEKSEMSETARKLASKALELSNNTDNRDAHILSTYIFAFIEEIRPIMLLGDKATTEENYIDYMRPYETLFEVAHAHNSFEFEYLALLNHARLKTQRAFYATGVSEKKSALINEILTDCQNLDEYESFIQLPHLHFYRYYLQIDVYTIIIYLEAAQEEVFNYYIDEALKSAEKMKEIFVTTKMKSVSDKVRMQRNLVDVYMMKASFTTSRQEKLEYLKRCESLLLEDERSPTTWSPQVYHTWRDLSLIYLDLSKIDHNKAYFEKCVFFAKKTYESALETENFVDALFEVYKIALIGEDFQEYDLSITHYELTRQVIDKIINAGKDFPYFHNLKVYLHARLLGVKAKEEHSKGNYARAMDLYRMASSFLKEHVLYSYEGLLYNAYSLFEKASMSFIEEKYRDTLETLSNITRLFDETTKYQTEYYGPQFQYFIDRRAYDTQQLFLESSKAFCIAQSNILQSLIYRNTGDSKKAIVLLKEASDLLSQFTEREIHIVGYYSFTNGLFGLEQSELAIRESEYRSAASYLESASAQFENSAQMLVSDKRLNRLCEGLMHFCRGWMYALEIMRRGTDLTIIELNKNFTLAHQSFKNAINDLKIFRKTCNGVQGFEKLLNYIHYSLLFQKTEDPAEKSLFKNKLISSLHDALQYFKDADDMERYGFTRDVLNTLPQLEDIRENIFKPINIPFTPYTPVFETTSKVEPSGVYFTISPNENQIEVNEKVRYKIHLTSDTLVYIEQIDGVFPKNGVKVVSGMRLAKNGIVKINRFLSPGKSILIEFTIQASKPLYSRKHPQLIYFNTKNEKYRAFSTPVTIHIYPNGLLKTDVVNKINEKVGQISEFMIELGIILGKFPIVYHNIYSYNEALSEYLFQEKKIESGKKKLKKNFRFSQLPIQQMAFVDPLGDVNILYDLNKYLHPRSITSLLNIIIHEKFGHGFFYQHTTLGKKLLELEYHRKGIALLMKELEKISNKFAIGLQWLCMTTLIVNEGFSVWLTLKTFEKLLEKTSRKDKKFELQVNQELGRIKSNVFENNNLNVVHEYFTLKFGSPTMNPYAFGYDLFSQIEKKFGEKCVPKALEMAANVLLTRRQISRMSKTIKDDKNCADKRLEKIAKSHFKVDYNNTDMFEDMVKKLF